MAELFKRTRVAIRAERSVATFFGFVLAVGVLGAWGAWFCLAHVVVYETAQAARLEVDRAVYPVQTVVAGRVVAAHLDLGRHVCPPDVLLELDASTERLSLHEEQTRRDAIVPQLAALERELATRQQAGQESLEVARASLEEARAHAGEARAAARFAALRAAQYARMQTAHLVADFDLQSARADAAQRRWAAAAADRVSERLDWEQRSGASERQATLDQLARTEADLRAQLTTTQATIERLEHEIALRTLRAPICGNLGDVTLPRAGSYLQPGERVATVVPAGTIRIVADFLPNAALGRIHRGQRAQMRLDGFPWTQYGSLRAVVSSVAGETHNDRVRVELAIEPDPRSPIPLLHGLPGTLEVAIDRVTPATLLMRSAGQAAPAAPAAAGAAAAP